MSFPDRATPTLHPGWPTNSLKIASTFGVTSPCCGARSAPWAPAAHSDSAQTLMRTVRFIITSRRAKDRPSGAFYMVCLILLKGVLQADDGTAHRTGRRGAFRN